MKDINIKLKSSGRCLSPNGILGITGENLQGNIVFSFCDDFIDGIGYVEIKKPDGTCGYVEAIKTNEKYILPIKTSLLNQVGIIRIQLRITQTAIGEEIPVFKSEVYNLTVNSAINATTTIPDEYPSWIDTANEALLEFQTAIEETENLDIEVDKVGSTSTVTITKKDGTTKSVEINDGETGAAGRDGIDGQGVNTGGTTGQVLKKVSNEDYDTEWADETGGGITDHSELSNLDYANSGHTGFAPAGNYVEDASYVHTDNNYTTEEKTKLSGLSNYDDTDIRNELNDKVDKVDGKGLSTNDYSTEEKNKLANIEAGAEVNTVDSVNGQTGTVEISVPTKLSDLLNDTNFIDNTVNNLTNYYLKSDTYTKTEVNDLISNINSFKVEVVEELPTENIDTHTIYLVQKESETNDNYDEYIYINNAWEHIGSTSVDLTDYYTKTETNNLLLSKANTSDLEAKQNVLTAGENITIENNVINALGGAAISFTADESIKYKLGKKTDFVSYGLEYNRLYILTNSMNLYYPGSPFVTFQVFCGTMFIFPEDGDGTVFICLKEPSTINEQKAFVMKMKSNDYLTTIIPMNALEDYNLAGNGSTKTKALATNNTKSYTPTANYHPATKKYVDDKQTTYTGYDATKTQVLKNINGVLTWVDEI